MVKIKGELYNITIEPLKISIEPISIQSLPTIVINGTSEEDFSIFDLGPAIINHIILQTGRCTIDNAIYEKTCVVIDQNPGHWILINIKQPRQSLDLPVDSGDTIHIMKEYIVKYE